MSDLLVSGHRIEPDAPPEAVVAALRERTRAARVWGVSMFRDEADVAYHTILHMAEEGLAGIIVADNLSSDGTRHELVRARREVAATCAVFIRDDPEPGYYQSDKMTALAAQAGELGADWIVPFDADELWYGQDRVARILDSLPEEYLVATAALFNHFPTSIDTPHDNPFRRIEWRQRQPGALPKVAFRWRQDARILQGNHDVEYAGGRRTAHLAHLPALELRHFPYRSYEQFRRKAVTGAAAYAATDLPLSEGAHWRQYGAILDRHGDDGPLGLRTVFERYFCLAAPVEEGMVHDPAPFRRWPQHTEPAPPADREQP